MNYLFIGQESYLKEEAIDNLKSKLLSRDFRELNFNIYYAGVDNIKDILSGANTLPFAAKFRIIVIKDIDKLPSKDRETLLGYLKKPAEQTTLILDSDKDLGKDQFAAKSARFVKLINFERPKGVRLDYWIKKEAQTFLDKRISKEAIDLLKELAGIEDLVKLKNELEKVSLFIGEKKDISKSDVETAVGKSANEDIFRLIDAVSGKNTELALDIISNLILRKVKPHEIIGLLAWHFRKLKRNPELLLSADLAIKRGRLKPALALEFVILELCR
ncbi:MAG: DNA polymerase III subunit delta [Candidatus Omnitrophica bacterium]|nr:DNA polymerase III subunit delta [Candidatus Omnitrophota bacterium]